MGSDDAFVVLLLAMIATLLAYRVVRAVRAGRVRVWNSVQLNRSVRPRLFWCWMTVLATACLVALGIDVVALAAFVAPNLTLLAALALLAGRFLVVAPALLAFALWRVARSAQR